MYSACIIDVYSCCLKLILTACHKETIHFLLLAVRKPNVVFPCTFCRGAVATRSFRRRDLPGGQDWWGAEEARRNPRRLTGRRSSK